MDKTASGNLDTYTENKIGKNPINTSGNNKFGNKTPHSDPNLVGEEKGQNTGVKAIERRLSKTKGEKHG